MNSSTAHPMLKYINDHIQSQDGNPYAVEVLGLRNKTVENICFLHLLPNLKIIDLRNAKINTMTGLETCLNLEQLYLCQNHIMRIQRIYHLPKLRMLDLRGNLITSLHTSLHAIPPSLTSLKLRHNKIVDARQICKLANKLDELWMDQNLLPKNSSKIIDIIFNLKNWDSRHLWHD